MNKQGKWIVLAGIFLLVGWVFSEIADKAFTDPLIVFIDCEDCDLDFIKHEIPFVSYGIDRSVVDIHILITTRVTAGEGIEHTLTFIGQQDFENKNDTLVFISDKQDSEDEIRHALVHQIKLGLVPYIAKTAWADDIDISVIERTRPPVVSDHWNKWVFSIGLQTYLQGEQLSSSTALYTTGTISRITDQWKLESSIYYDHDQNRYEIDDTTTISSISKSYGSGVFLVRSIDEHWSWAAGLDLYSSTYRNKDFAFFIYPTLEYNIFPYFQSTRRELRISYKIGYVYNNYTEETIYDKTEEKLFHESLAATLDMKQPWGSVSTTLAGYNYFHDLEKNRITLISNISLRLVKGFSLDLYGDASWIHDRLSLPKRDLTPEEIILQIRQQATQYDYYMSIGLTYTFGSLYSNIVNPRFGD
jgi:hypothetical protein